MTEASHISPLFDIFPVVCKMKHTYQYREKLKEKDLYIVLFRRDHNRYPGSLVLDMKGNPFGKNNIRDIIHGEWLEVVSTEIPDKIIDIIREHQWYEMLFREKASQKKKVSLSKLSDKDLKQKYRDNLRTLQNSYDYWRKMIGISKSFYEIEEVKFENEVILQLLKNYK